MLVDNYLRLWAPSPLLKKKGLQPPMVNSHLAFIIITPFVWAHWAVLLPYQAISHHFLDVISGQHYFIPILVLEGLEIGVLGWLWRWSMIERLKAKKLMK
ncbi:hypothetical protein DL96DRAFT_504074 [Flagelloscypha sp. PMI_526]|nr:hypothetical protein DL96DRAFT_504074 [Flagelloscypha sp. PMI_526]